MNEEIVFRILRSNFEIISFCVIRCSRFLEKNVIQISRKGNFSQKITRKFSHKNNSIFYCKLLGLLGK